MDWPHDPDGEHGSEGMRKYGHAILAKKLDEAADFPLSTEEFLADHGDDPIRLNHEEVVSVADIFAHVDAEEFPDMVAFHETVGAAMRSAGMWEIDVQRHV